MLKIGMHVFFIFCIVLLLVNLVAFVLFETASEPITFSALLDKVEEAPKIDLSIEEIESFTKITADWKDFNALRDLINAITGAISVLIWLCTLLINLISIIVYLAYVFGLSSFSSYI